MGGTLGDGVGTSQEETEPVTSSGATETAIIGVAFIPDEICARSDVTSIELG